MTSMLFNGDLPPRGGKASRLPKEGSRIKNTRILFEQGEVTPLRGEFISSLWFI